MTRPKTSTLVVGYPAIGVPLLLGDGLFAYEVVIHQEGGWYVLMCLLFAGWVSRCLSEAGRYRALKREWDALAPAGAPAGLRIGRVLALLATLGLALGGWLYVLPALADPASPARLIAGTGLAVLAAVFFLRRRRKSAAANSSQWIVAQAARPTIPASSVAAAYAALPDYCARLVSPPNVRKGHA